MRSRSWPQLLTKEFRELFAARAFWLLLLFVGLMVGVSMFASARPFNATTGVDNNGDGINNDRPVIDGAIINKSAFRGTPTSDVAVFVEKRFRTSEHTNFQIRLEGFNLFNHGNFLGRGVTVFGNGATAVSTFGQFVSNVGTAANAIPAFANIDPPRMFQVIGRFTF